MLFLLLVLISSVEGLFFPLYAVHRPQCFLTKAVPAEGSISGSYEVSGSSEGMSLTCARIYYEILEIVVSLKHPTTDTPVWTSRQLADNFKYTVTAPGQYNLCFQQTSTRSRQTASFDIHVTGEVDYYEDVSANLASKSQAEKVGILARQVENKVNDLLDQQSFSITREAIHRETAESTNSSVLWWSIGRMAILITLSVVQLYYVKSFFEIKLIV